jgi:hypothetical protein
MGASIANISTSDRMFEQISNIGCFLDFVRSTGVADKDTFVTTDLYDNKDMRQVMVGLNSLGRALHKLPRYSGPTISRVEAQRRNSSFSVQSSGFGPGMRPISKTGSVYDSLGDKSPGGGLRPGSETFGIRTLSVDEKNSNAAANSALAEAAALQASSSSAVLKVPSMSSKFRNTILSY